MQVIYCPKEVQLICLSATVANPEELAGWISQVHGPTELVTSSKRPVPLVWHFSTRSCLLPLLSDEGTGMNMYDAPIHLICCPILFSVK
jgi:superfamily II RNA helicase